MLKNRLLLAFLAVLSLAACKQEIIDPDPDNTAYTPWEALYWVECTSYPNSGGYGLSLSDDTLRIRQTTRDTLTVNGIAYILRDTVGMTYYSLEGKSLTVFRNADTLTLRHTGWNSSSSCKGRKVADMPVFADVNNELAIGLPDTVRFDSLATYTNLSADGFSRFVWVFPYSWNGGVITFHQPDKTPIQVVVSSGSISPSPIYDSATFSIQLRAYRPDGSRINRSFPVKIYR